MALFGVDELFLFSVCCVGLFLTAGEPLLGDESKRVVCLRKENSTDMQVWKIEPFVKKV
jgi:hypothetical protein